MKLYSFLRKLVSEKNKGRLTRLLYYIGLKPTCNNQAKSPFSKGIIIFSADFEMSWAFRFSKKKQNISEQLGLQERYNVPILLELFDKYKIPVTWATVGHLFLDQCNIEDNNLPHSNMPRPDFFENKNWFYKAGDWYAHDPCSNVERSPGWYAPDLIKKILEADTQHEIGCHTFSHIDCTEKNCSPELFLAEITKCKSLAEKRNLFLKSMVYPGGTIGNLTLLKLYGFTSYRKPMKFDIDMPKIHDDGLIALPSTLGLDKDPYGWSKEFHLYRIRKLLQKTLKKRMMCHLWFHPSMDKWYIKNVFPLILEEVALLRDKGKLDIFTMEQAAEVSHKLL